MEVSQSLPGSAPGSDYQRYIVYGRRRDPTVREFEGLLRDAGFSKAKAAAIAAAATPHLRGEPEGEVDPMVQFWALMRAAPIIDNTGE